MEILSELLHDELVFVNHFGQRLTKTADLQAHHSGRLNFTLIEVLEQQVILLASSAVTVTRVSLKGTVGWSYRR
ncbi:nuclear transport factor 2 family protein [Lysinibacillus sphaericus]